MREVARVSAGRAFPKEDAHANGTRAGFFQCFNLPQSHERGEFVTFAHDGFGRSRPTGHRAADEILGDFFKIGFEFRVSGFEVNRSHKIYYPSKCAGLSRLQKFREAKDVCILVAPLIPRDKYRGPSLYVMQLCITIRL